MQPRSWLVKAFIVTGMALAVFASACAQTPADSLARVFRGLFGDSTLASYSLEELQAYRQLYASRLAARERERAVLRQRGIRDAELFIAQNPNSRVLDEVMMRLAELCFEQAQEEYLAAMRQYEEELAAYDRGERANPPTEPRKDFDKPLGLLQAVVERFPHSEYVDDALYNRAFILEDLRQDTAAVAVYQRVVQEFPESPYVPSALLRIGEYYFSPPRNDLHTAIQYYERVLQYRDSPRYDEALYRLGWSHYRLSQFPQAVSYFTLLADDIERNMRLDPQGVFTNPALRDEAVEYIGISFLDYGGPARAAQYLQEIGHRSYGAQILKRMGDAYLKEKEEYANAIYAYRLLLAMYPDSPLAPVAQSRIVEAYRLLKDEPMAYVSRNQLVSLYGEGSSWWAKNTDEATRSEARRLAEAALRDNIAFLYQQGEATGDRDFYEQAVSDSRKYLEKFPADSSAPRVHWNMALTLDTQLHDYPAAYAEYLQISQRYWNSRYQRQAAENAVALAREAAREQLAAAEAEAETSRAVSRAEEVKRESAATIHARLVHPPTPLQPTEQRLAEAYDNYIMLFPHEPQTARMLVNAGALYYNHNQFKEALKYFKTLIKHFPESEELADARYILMESYFGKMDFASAEVVAKRIIQDNPSPELVSKARRRLAESIFLAAELLAEADEHASSAEEFRRVVTEVPEVPFGDLALFNSALEFDKAQEFNRAIDAYLQLLAGWPSSPYRFDALNNLAFDYREVNDFYNAALTYERLASLHPDAEKAKDALFNASVCFAASEDWGQAIRVNRLFLERYPQAREAEDLAYDIAGYYLKLRDWQKASESYGEFVAKYPTSPRVVESYYRRGEYFAEQGNREEAAVEYRKAVASHDELKAKGLPGNDFYAAEALFALAELDFARLAAIELRLPKARLQRSLQEKRELLLRLVKDYTRVAGFGTVRLYEATFRVGNCYEEFARSYAWQEIPRMDPTEEVVARNEVADVAAQLYRRAVDSYRTSLSVLTRLAENYRRQLPVPPGADSAQVAAGDSVLRVAQRWLGRCKEKVCENLYTIAELKKAAAERLLAAPLPLGLDLLSAVEYRRQVLTVAAKPWIQGAVEAYAETVQEGVSLGVDNAWVQQARSAVIRVSNLLPDHFAALATEVLDDYRNREAQYLALVETGAQVTQAGEDLVELADQMANLLDFGAAFAVNFTSGYEETLKRARAHGFDGEGLPTTEEKLTRGLFSYVERLDSLCTLTRQRKVDFEAAYRERQEPVYRDAMLTFEDNYFAAHEGLLRILETGVGVCDSLGIDNVWSKNLVLHLARFAPDTYAARVGLVVVADSVATDQRWRAYHEYAKGWTSPGFDEEGWTVPTIVAAAREPGRPTGFYLWSVRPETVAVHFDTLKQVLSSDVEYRLGPVAYLRGTFIVEGLPVNASVHLAADASYNLFVNGHYIAQVVNPPDKPLSVYVHDVTDFLQTGPNVVAVQAKDEDGEVEGLQVTVKWRSLPNWAQTKQSLRPVVLGEEERRQLLEKREQIP
ncbi:MAG: tetratricopeptide repeat protein [candidate division KSB1 bacterium]|nr:tetratricopeptide repeat protein [candidate division KSB1 bacterium]